MRRAATTVTVSLLLCLAAAPAYAAAGDPVTGYWTRTRTGLPVPVQPPNPVPPGGTWVSGDPAGPVAVSALRTELTAGLLGVELRLEVADRIGTAAVQACPSSDRWAPEQGGRLEAAPEADCSAPLDARLEGDLLVVPLPPGLGDVNVLLRPKPGAVFSLTLEKATAQSVVTAPAPSPAVAPVAAPPPPPPAQAAAPPPAFSAGFDAPLEPSLPVPGPDPLLAAPLLPAAAPAPAPAPAPQAAPAPVTFQAATPRAALTPDDRTPALLATAVLVLLGVQAMRLAGQPATPPRALGGAARRSRPAPATVVAVPARGVGRFRRPAELQPAGTPARGVGRFRSARVRPPVRI